MILIIILKIESVKVHLFHLFISSLFKKRYHKISVFMKSLFESMHRKKREFYLDKYWSSLHYYNVGSQNYNRKMRKLHSIRFREFSFEWLPILSFNDVIFVLSSKIDYILIMEYLCFLLLFWFFFLSVWSSSYNVMCHFSRF